jgi:hypothetical protein
MKFEEWLKENYSDNEQDPRLVYHMKKAYEAGFLQGSKFTEGIFNL